MEGNAPSEPNGQAGGEGGGGNGERPGVAVQGEATGRGAAVTVPSILLELSACHLFSCTKVHLHWVPMLSWKVSGQPFQICLQLTAREVDQKETF